MTSIVTPLKLELLHDGKWKLLENFTYIGFFTNYTAEKGFITDLATVPRILWPLIAPTDVPYAAVIHDLLLIELHKKQIKQRFKRLAAWRQANAVFASAMTLSPKKVPIWRRWAVKKAVNMHAIIKCLLFNKQPDIYEK